MNKDFRIKSRAYQRNPPSLGNKAHIYLSKDGGSTKSSKIVISGEKEYPVLQISANSHIRYFHLL